MKELTTLLKDSRFYIPAGFILCLEIFLQSGLYKYLLKPDSYAANIINIEHTTKDSPVHANYLILGTSVAYQGINLPLLNEKMKSRDAVFQSGASQGAKLITQHAIFRNIIPDLPRTKYIIHISEITFPWTARRTLDVANRSMLAQFPRFDTLKLLEKQGYILTADDYSNFLVRSVTYKSDLRDFFLGPLNRIKHLAREAKKEKSLYPYENWNEYGMDVLGSMTTRECADLVPENIKEFDTSNRRITDETHITAMKQTCQLAMYDPMSDPGSEQWADLYFERFAMLVKDADERGIQIITVFPPYSEFIQDPKAELKMKIWNEHLKKIYGSRPYTVINLWHSLDGPENRSLFYDTIHLNRKGSLRFTEKLAEQLEILLPEQEK